MQPKPVSSSSHHDTYFTGPSRASKLNSSKKQEKAMQEATHIWKSSFKPISDSLQRPFEEEEHLFLFLPDYAVPAESPSIRAQSPSVDLRSSRAVAAAACTQTTKRAGSKKQEHKGDNLCSIGRKQEEADCNSSVPCLSKPQAEYQNGQDVQGPANQSLNDSIQTYVEEAELPTTLAYQIDPRAPQESHQQSENEEQSQWQNEQENEKERKQENEEEGKQENEERKQGNEEERKQEKVRPQQSQICSSSSRKEGRPRLPSLQSSHQLSDSGILGLVFDCCAGWLFRNKFPANLHHLFAQRNGHKESKTGYQPLRPSSPEQQQKMRDFNRHMFVTTCQRKIKEGRQQLALERRQRRQRQREEWLVKGHVAEMRGNSSLSTIRQEEFEESVAEIYKQEKKPKQLQSGFSQARTQPLPSRADTFQELTGGKYREGVERAELFRIVSQTPVSFSPALFPSEWHHSVKASQEQRQLQQKMKRGLTRIASCDLGSQRAQMLRGDKVRLQARKREDYVEMEVPAKKKQRGFRINVPAHWRVQFL